MKLVRMTPGQGDLLLEEGDPELAEDEERLVAEFRRQLELGMWAVVPLETTSGRREAQMIREFGEIPAGADQVIFFPPAAGGSAREDAREKGMSAQERAEELLASAAGPEALEMFKRVGFLDFIPNRDKAGRGREAEQPGYGYLIYPHRPLLAYDAKTGEPLSEFCVRFQDANERLPDADDVLAKYLALKADEKLVIGESNIDRVGVQLDPEAVRRDLRTLGMWRRNADRPWKDTA